MKLCQQLKEEFTVQPKGKFSPAYFKYLGYHKNPGAPVADVRAAMANSLFAAPDPYIYKNDRIAGAFRSMWVEQDDDIIARAEGVYERYGERSFGNNSDHYAPGYTRFVTKGVVGILAEIDESMDVHKEDAVRIKNLKNMRLAMEGLQTMLLRHAEKAESLKGAEGYRNEYLDSIAKNCHHLANAAPETFEQALQLVWMAHTCFLYEGRYAMALGRIDQYLYPFYKKDKEAGILTDDDAVELLANTFIKIYERHVYFNSDDVVNICIGGADAKGNCQINDLSYCVLWAVRDCNVPGPNLSARITLDTPDYFLDECLKVIGTGLGYPALMNDRVIQQALLRFGYDPEDVADFAMVGCIENFLPGMQPPWTDARFDTPSYIGKVLHSTPKDEILSVYTGDISTIDSMDEFMRRYEKQLAYGISEYVSDFRNWNGRYNPNTYTSPFLSCFDTTCIQRGLDINNGGTKYPSVHGAALMGVGTTADSLAAIEKLVFVDKEVTMQELSNALDKNFEGYDELRAKLLAAPKYGNNDHFVDKYAVWFLEYLTSEFDKYRTEDGGGIYTAMAANTSNIWAGYSQGATPDGRLAGEPLSDAASPTYGRDVNGATTTVLSITKPDYTLSACGTVINQKFSPGMFADGKRQKLLSLIKVYMQKGGQEMQINATSTEVLRDAIDHPENYQDLVVRVSGFSALYVTLDPAVQRDILQRTQQE